MQVAVILRDTVIDVERDGKHWTRRRYDPTAWVSRDSMILGAIKGLLEDGVKEFTFTDKRTPEID